MGGIPLLAGGRVTHYPAVWAEADDVPVVFTLVRSDGSVGLGHPDYIADRLDEIQRGNIDREDAWMHLLIKTPEMDFPAPCFVEVKEAEGGKAIAEFRTGNRAGFIRYSMEI